LIALALGTSALTSELAFVAFNPDNWVDGHTPADWRVKVNHGRPQVNSCTDGNCRCVRLRSFDSSFALERETDVDPYKTRYLTWHWKVTQLPAGGDFRRPATDDQAAQVLVAFADRRVLSYIWDSTAPKGTMESSGSVPLVHIFVIVCESGTTEAGRWLREVRDVAADYERAYGKPAPHIKGLRLQINSQHTGNSAESYFEEVAFRSQQPN
jgi:hypothetical protein